MSILENSIFFKILKETTTFLTHMDNLSLKIFCNTSLGESSYKNY
jgi:hypothetical protein